MRSLLPRLLVVAVLCHLPSRAAGEELHQRIDRLVLAGAGDAKPVPRADDAEFLRRVYLDFAGRIPSTAEARSFLADTDPGKRAKLIGQLLAGPDYPRAMQERFHAMLMERLGDHPAWSEYLRASFAANKPWDQVAREILRADPRDEDARGANFFYARRLEHYGENPIDYPGLTRDVGRLFLGVDLGCAQCHDHLFIRDYKQLDFQGMFAFFQNTYLQDPKAPLVGEKPTTKKLEFMSVFKKEPRATGPRLPGGEEVAIPPPKEGEVKPKGKKEPPAVPSFSPLEELANRLPRADNPGFTRNSANRLWYLLMGRGIVHPLDLHHEANPPSHPELLDLLAREFADHKFDIKWLLRELALSETYQRASWLPEGQPEPKPDRFLMAQERRLIPEQLLASVLEALGERPSEAERAEAEKRFLQAFAHPPRDPADEFSPTLKGALFVLNEPTVLGWLRPRGDNLIARLQKVEDPARIAEELYLAVLTRLPTPEEVETVADYLARKKDRKADALGHLAWALLASTEFNVNH